MPGAIAGTFKAPFDILADKLRGYIGLTMDMYANWDAFAAANPTYRIAKGQQAFIIADWGPTDVNLTGIDLN